MPGWDWDEDLTSEQRDTLIERLAERIVRHRLQMPAILVLEMHKPFAFLAGQSLLLGSGFLAPLFGPQNIRQYSKLFENRDNIERLMERIEELDVLEKQT